MFKKILINYFMFDFSLDYMCWKNFWHAFCKYECEQKETSKKGYQHEARHSLHST